MWSEQSPGWESHRTTINMTACIHKQLLVPVWISDEEQLPPTPGSPQATCLPTVKPMGVVTRVSLTADNP